MKLNFWPRSVAPQRSSSSSKAAATTAEATKRKTFGFSRGAGIGANPFGSVRPPQRKSAHSPSAGVKRAPGPHVGQAKSDRPAERHAELRNLLNSLPIERLDALSHRELALIVRHLGVPLSDVRNGAALEKNWKALRSAFPKREELDMLLQLQPSEVARFIVSGPASGHAKPSPQAGNSHETGSFPHHNDGPEQQGPPGQSKAPGAGARPSDRSVHDVRRLLNSLPEEHFRSLTRGQIALVVEQLGLPPDKIIAGENLDRNWASLLATFPNRNELDKLLQHQPLNVAKFIVFGPSAARNEGPNRSTADRQSAYSTQAGTANKRAGQTASEPFSLASVSRVDVVGELRKRGLDGEGMKELKSDFRNFFLNGGDAIRNQLTQKYASILNDDLTNETSLRAIARNLLAVRA